MKAEGYLKQKIKNMSGSLLVIGQISDKDESFTVKNLKISEIYWLNSNTTEDSSDEEAIDIGKDISLNKLRKYLKQGVDNVVCEYAEVKNHMPEFIKESMNVTKGNLYLFLKKKDGYSKILNKFKRYKLNYKVEELDDCNVIVVEVNDVIVNTFKEKYYYVVDLIEKYYNKISDNM